MKTTSQLDRLYEQHIGFICGFNTDENICESAVDSLAPQLSSDGPDTFLAEYGVQAKTLKTFWPHRDKETHNPENGPLNFHVYLDPLRAACEKEILLKRLREIKDKLEEKVVLKDSDKGLVKRFFIKDKQGWRYSPEKWKEEDLTFGLQVLASNKEVSDGKALDLYLQPLLSKII